MRIAVIGGGAAGLMCAVAAASHGADVTLFERNEKPGKKIYITGKGRCNVTNIADKDGYMGNILRNPRFLYSAFARFDNLRLMETLESLGVPLVTERGGRVFPANGKSSDIIRALANELKRLKVDVRLNSRVGEVFMKAGGAAGLVVNGRRLEFDSVAVCTGGLTYPSTGSTGDGYNIARAAGHSVTGLYPALCGLNTREGWVKTLQGLTLKNVALKAFWNGKSCFSEMGEALFTHFGISGPLALTLSSLVCDVNGDISVTLDLKPALDDMTLDRRLLRDFGSSKNKSLKNALDGLLPQKMIPVFLDLMGGICAPETKVHDITKGQRLEIVRLLKSIPLTVTGTRPWEEAVITRGGVTIGEVSPKTMESKLVKGLYFAGEVLDVDALTGGFNLQIAFSTGYLAGVSAAGADFE